METNIFSPLKEIYAFPKENEDDYLPGTWVDPSILDQWIKNITLAPALPTIEKITQKIKEQFKTKRHLSVCHVRCGPGLYAEQLAKQGMNVLGIDFSKNVIDYAIDRASKNNLNIDYMLSKDLNFKLNKKFDLILMVGRDFSALSSKQRHCLLTKFYNAISDTGVIFLNVTSLRQYRHKKENTTCGYFKNGGFWSKNPYFLFHGSFKDEKNKGILDKFTIIEELNIKEISIFHQCYTIDSLTQELNQSSFEVRDFLSNMMEDPYTEASNEIGVIFSKTPAMESSHFVPDMSTLRQNSPELKR